MEPGHPDDGEEKEGRIRGLGQEGGKEEEEAPLEPEEEEAINP